jgi:thioester reductase-like protein
MASHENSFDACGHFRLKGATIRDGCVDRELDYLLAFDSLGPSTLCSAWLQRGVAAIHVVGCTLSADCVPVYGSYLPEERLLSLCSASRSLSPRSLQIVVSDANDNPFGESIFVANGRDNDGNSLAAVLEPIGWKVCGTWLGQAVCDDSLAAFAIPSNPIDALIAFNDDELVYGVGFFDDCEEAAEQGGVLYYSLSGRCQADGSIELAKRYWQGDESDEDALVVHYRGALGDDGLFSGTWRNDAHGSFGSFRCYLQTGADGGASSLCARCWRPLSAGAMRYACHQCFAPAFAACEACTDAEHCHHHALVAERVPHADVAVGQSCAAMVDDALQRFAERRCVAVFGDGALQRELSYAEVAAIARPFAADLVARGIDAGDAVALVADISPELIAALLGATLAGVCIVPVHPALSDDAFRACLRMCAPKLVVVARVYRERLVDCDVPIADLDALSALSPSSSTSIVRPPPSSSATIALLFTSGTTSTVPKAAAYSDALLLPNAASNAKCTPLVRLDIQRFHPSLLVSLIGVVQVGGQRALATDLGTWLLDAQCARPTHVSAPPLFWTMLQREHAALAVSPSSRAEASRRVRSMLGNRLVSAHSGGSALPEATAQFVRAELGIAFFHDLYGAREVGGIARDGIVYDSVRVRIEPRDGIDDASVGELLVHTDAMIAGYSSDAANERAFCMHDGVRYYRTGDLVVYDDKTRRVRVLGRCASTAKLANSLFVHLERTELALESCAQVKHAYAAVEPGRSYVVAIVVLHGDGDDNESVELCDDVLRAELRFWCAHANLPPDEVPQRIGVDRNAHAWADMLTSTMKKRRSLLALKYADAVKQLYEAEPKHDDGSAALRVCDTLRELLERVGLPFEGASATDLLAELGLNSLACAQLLRLLPAAAERLSLTAPSLLAMPIGHLDQLVRRIDNDEFVSSPSAAAADVDWHREQCLPADLQQVADAAASAVASSSDASKQDVLCTGATGFLGVYLLAELLKRFDGRIHVLVRGNDGRARLERAMRRAHVWPSSDDARCERICVVRGDVAQRQLGIADDDYAHLCESVAHVFHNAANVNMVLPYRALRRTNVEGTLHVAHLCVRARAPLLFVSSLSAYTVELDRWPLVDKFSSAQLNAKTGYGASKAVAEQLLGAAVRAGVLQARVVRPGTISGAGVHWNRSDFCMLLMRACIALGVRVSPAPLAQRWLPVDFVAHAIVRLAQRSDEPLGFSMCGDGPTLDALFDALAQRCQLRAIAPEQFAAELLRLADDHPASPLRDKMRRICFDGGAIDVDINMSNAKAALHDIDWPAHHDLDSFARCLLGHCED